MLLLAAPGSSSDRRSDPRLRRRQLPGRGEGVSGRRLDESHRGVRFIFYIFFFGMPPPCSLFSLSLPHFLVCPFQAAVHSGHLCVEGEAPGQLMPGSGLLMAGVILSHAGPLSSMGLCEGLIEGWTGMLRHQRMEELRYGLDL